MYVDNNNNVIEIEYYWKEQNSLKIINMNVSNLKNVKIIMKYKIILTT